MRSTVLGTHSKSDALWNREVGVEIVHRLADSQCAQGCIIDPPGDGELIDGLEPANRFCGFWAEGTVDIAMIITKVS